MAGMLPGVEAARRRRIPQSSGYGDDTSTTTRRSSFCLYAARPRRHEHHPCTNSPPNSVLQVFDIESQLSPAAREAKKRLDERLKHPQNKSIMSSGYESRMIRTDSASKICRMKRRLNWLKFRGKSTEEEEECAVCLGQLKQQEEMRLACTHKFHTKCLVPWLDNNPHCPCCRMNIPSSSIRPRIQT